MLDNSVADALALIEELRATDGLNRPLVAQKLEERGKDVVQPLIQVLLDSTWPVRYWAARILGAAHAREALPDLKAQASVETDSLVRQEMAKVISLLEEPASQIHTDVKMVAAPGAAPNPANDASLGVTLQRDIIDLQRRLRRAYSRGNAGDVHYLRDQLVSQQVRLYFILTGGTQDGIEIARVRALYVEASEREQTKAEYKNVCWVCMAHVEAGFNTHCSCGWLVCVCGACQCPDFSVGPRGRQRECHAQVERLGAAKYAELLEQRKNRMGWDEEEERMPEWSPLADDIPW
jgi:hypothetical protein